MIDAAQKLGALLTVSVLLCGPSYAGPSVNNLSADFQEFHELRSAGRLEEAEALLQRVLPTPLSEPSQKKGAMKISIYALSWSMLALEHLRSFDYGNAARILSDRVAIAERTLGQEHAGVAGFLALLGKVNVRQGKYDIATPLFERSLRIYMASGRAQGRIADGVYLGLAECLLAQKRAAEAEALLLPRIQQMLSDDRLDMAESVANTYAVALREAGSLSEADQMVELVDRKSFLTKGINAQERDLLRARVLAAQGSLADADAIYRNWIRHWEESGETDRILTEPLQRYAEFLKLVARDTEAAAVLQRLRSIDLP